MAKLWSINLIGGLFAIALAFLLVLVLRSIAVQVTPPPSPLTEAYPDTSTQEKCEAAGGRWITQPEEAAVRVAPVAEKIQPYCQGPLTFEREHTAQEEQSRETSLFVFALGGGIAVAAGILLHPTRAVASGLLLGGIVSFFIATIHVWTLAPGIGRLITILVIFAALLGLGLHIFRDKAEPTTPKIS